MLFHHQYQMHICLTDFYLNQMKRNCDRESFYDNAKTKDLQMLDARHLILPTGAACK